MSSTINTFVWFELNTTDKAAASAFYSELFGWSIADKEPGVPDTYTGLSNNGASFGGMDLARDGAPAHWLGYIDADDVDARVAKLERLGGHALMPGFDIPGVGRIAVVADNNGAIHALYCGTMSAHSKGWEPSRDKTGDIGWSELMVADVPKARAYYGEGFGWSVGDGMPMPDGGVYLMFQVGEKMIGGLLQKPDEMPVSAFMFYVNVEDVNATAAKAEALGGSVIVNQVIPGMVHFAVLIDPQGAVIGIVKSMSH